MPKVSVSDDDGAFDVTVFEASAVSRVVLFAVGGGGDPGRHVPLLTALAERGCAVVAPHFARLLTPSPTDDDLLLRARRLRLALDAVARPGAVTVGIGHSIGATTLLALAGAEIWMRSGPKLPIAPDPRLDRLALLTPATDFFRAPGALAAVRTPILAWAATSDAMTPPRHVELLQSAIDPSVRVEVRVAAGAGHFSFMNTPPPNTVEPLPDRDAFLSELTRELCRFAMG
jgi:fermentation-respiration switch protein FrsA (DUF1100 family)